MSKTNPAIPKQNLQPEFANVNNSRFYMARRNEQAPLDSKLHHYHDCYELYYLYSGERYYFIQDQTYHITKGAFVLINPYEIHQTGNLGNFGYDRMLIHFNKELLEDYLEDDPQLRPYDHLENKTHIISLDPGQQTFAETLLSLMATEYKKNRETENTYIKLTLLQLLLFLNRCKPGANDEALPQINATQKTIFETVGYINNYYNEDITLETISEKYYLSPFYFSRTFREITGFNFVEYLNNVRIKEAKKLLLGTNMTIGDISTAVGYNSSTHFGRVFKKIEGVSPSIFQKKSHL